MQDECKECELAIYDCPGNVEGGECHGHWHFKPKAKANKPSPISSTGFAGYVAVLTRGIPIDGPMVDTITHVCTPHETVTDLMQWVDSQTEGSAWMVKLEITKAT